MASSGKDRSSPGRAGAPAPEGGAGDTEVQRRESTTGTPSSSASAFPTNGPWDPKDMEDAIMALMDPIPGGSAEIVAARLERLLASLGVDDYLGWAAGHGKKDIVDGLLKIGFDVNAKNTKGCTGACGGRGAEAPTDSAQRS